MKILAVHSSSTVLGVALVRERTILGETILPPGREHLENLPLIIRDLLRSLNLTLTEVDGLAVALGPGSFSGIRVGLATVKGIALALNKPVVGVSSLHVLAWQALQDGVVAAVINAKRGEWYVEFLRRTEDSFQTLNGPVLLPADRFPDLAAKINEPITVCSDTALDVLGKANPVVEQSFVMKPSPAACALAAWDRFRKGDTAPLHSLSPLYIRRSDAEVNRLL